MTIKPITPADVAKIKISLIPEGVIDAFNKTIAKHWNGRSATFRQAEVMDLITATTDYTRQQVYDNKWLDVEDCYRENGWKVTYDKPGYSESYEPTFAFAAK